MNAISKSVQKIDHTSKANGSALYVCDYPTDGMLFGRILRSHIARGKVLSVSLPDLPAGYFYVDKNDIPGVNEVHMILDDTPVFTDSVEFIGDPIGMLVGDDEHEVGRLLGEIEVEYEEKTPVFDARESEEVFFEYNIDKGDTDVAFKEADRVFEESFETGLQEHIYLETNGMIADFKDGKMIVHGSIQCPYYVHTAVTRSTGLAPENVIVRRM